MTFWLWLCTAFKFLHVWVTETPMLYAVPSLAFAVLGGLFIRDGLILVGLCCECCAVLILFFPDRPSFSNDEHDDQ